MPRTVVGVVLAVTGVHVRRSVDAVHRLACAVDVVAIVGCPPWVDRQCIDEATAVIVRGGTLEVVGRSAVVVFDARRADVRKGTAASAVGATGIVTSVLRQGMTLTIDR